jgi:HD-like signal output (HDOD) protein
MEVTSEVERIVQGAGDLPAMPMVAQKVMQLVGDEATTPADLQRVISADPALASKVLRVANSALFSRVRAVSTLSHAVLILGYSTIRSLVIATSVRSLFVTSSDEFGLKEQMLWEHSLGCGVAARILSERLDHQGVEGAFIGGLLHDVGKVVLNANLPAAYHDVFREAYNEGRPVAEVERARLGFTHAQVGALLVRRWNFSPALEDVLANHHSPLEAEREPYGAALVCFANDLCHRLGIGCRADETVDLRGGDAARVLGLQDLDLDQLAAQVRRVLEEEKGIFDS